MGHPEVGRSRSKSRAGRPGSLHDDGTFHYPLKCSAFNYLAGGGHDVRHYLVLCIVPPDGNDYADAGADRLKLRQALYCHSLHNDTARRQP